MKTIKFIITIFVVVFIVQSCSENTQEVIKDPFVIAFKEKNINFNNIEKEYNVPLSFSEQSISNGSVVIKLTEENMVYGVDYKTIPAAVNGILEIPFTPGTQKMEFTYVPLKKVTNVTSKITCTITKINYKLISSIQGVSKFEFSFSGSLGGEFSPTIGGPNEPNQVFIDLGNKTEIVAKRDSWGIGFYSGKTFNVVLNETNYAAAGIIDGAIDIDKVTKEDVKDLQKKVTIRSGKVSYIDDPAGDFSKNAIQPIEVDEKLNKVYLLNLGYSVPTVPPKSIGSANVSSKETMGWRKIRILRKDNGYVLQYAKLEETTHKEVFISKATDGHAFTYFDFISEKIVTVAPKQKNWDISFTVFSNSTLFKGAPYAYGFSDFVYSNKLGGVQGYLVKETKEVKYDTFTKGNINVSQLKDDRRIPGGGEWRSAFKRTIKEGVFFVIKDTDGNLYKLKFLQLVNEKGERGYTKFKYELLR